MNSRRKQRIGPSATARRLGALFAIATLVTSVAITGLASSAATAATTTTRATTPTTAPQTTTTLANRATTTLLPSPTTTTGATTTTTAAATTSPRRDSTTTTTTTTPSSTTAQSPPAGVTLVSQAPWIPTSGVEVLQLHLDEPALQSDPDADVEVTIHRSVTARSEFDRAVAGDDLGSTVTRLTFPISQLQINKRHNFLVGFGLSGSGVSRSVGIDSAGVYPIEVGVVGGNTAHATFVTWMVVVDQSNTTSEPLRFSWIWQLGTGPLELPNGDVNASTLDALRPGGRLSNVATLLAKAGAFPLTLGIGPETLAVWGKEAKARPLMAPAVRQVERAAARASTQLLPEPYVPIEGPTIEAEQLGSHLPQEYVAGADAVEQATAQIPDPRTAFVDPIDEATVSRLTQMLVGRFVVRDTALVPVAEPLTPAQPFVLTTGTGIVAPAAATDTGLENLVESSGPPALRAQRVVAALAEIAYEAPSQARGVVLATPSDWSPDVATVELLLADLKDNPLVKPATLDTLFAEVPPATTDAGPLQRQLAPTSPPKPLPLHQSEYDNAVRRLAAYAAIVGKPNDPSVEAGRQALLLSLSTENTRSEALAYLDTISIKLHTLTSGITTTVKTLTLTARRADLPLSFQNNTGRAVSVKVHLDSPKLIFPKGPDVILTLPVGHTTAKRNQFPVEARASGTFAMTITLESPDGSIPFGAPTRVTIRSAVFSGIGIALTLGALLFLAAWWGNHFRRTRRDRRRAAAAT